MVGHLKHLSMPELISSFISSNDMFLTCSDPNRPSYTVYRNMLLLRSVLHTGIYLGVGGGERGRR